MPEKARYNEPLRDLAPEAYRLSQFLCGPCRDLHGLWPYIRLSRASTGFEAPESRLQDELRILFDRGSRRLLIAGAQDTGLLSLMVRSSAGHNVEITVLDICETPLELCRGLAKQWSLSIATIRQDLFDFRVERQFDIVLMHGTLHFIAADRRLEVLRRIRHALHPTGRLIVLFNTSHPVSTDLDRQNGDDYASTVLSELKKLAVPLPESEAVMRERLTAHRKSRGASISQWAERIALDREFTKRTQFGGDSRPTLNRTNCAQYLAELASRNRDEDPLCRRGQIEDHHGYLA